MTGSDPIDAPSFVPESGSLGMIERSQLIVGHVYSLRSRNLSFGVYVTEDGDVDDGFIGIREKFGNTFLFREFHWDNGPPFGTAVAIEDLGEVPEKIELIEGRLKDRVYYQNKELYEYLEQFEK